jgi:anti-sigma factor RsiW
MNCKTCMNHLSAYLDGELTDAIQRSVAGHLDGCADCRVEHAQLKSTWDLLEALPEPEVRPYTFTRLKARMEQPVANRPFPWLERVLLPALTTMMLLAGVALGSRAAQSAVVSEMTSIEIDAPDYLETLSADSLSATYSDLVSRSVTGSGDAL